MIDLLQHELSHKKCLLQGIGNVFTKDTPLYREAGTSADILLYGESIFGIFPQIVQITEPIALKILKGGRLNFKENFDLFYRFSPHLLPQPPYGKGSPDYYYENDVFCEGRFGSIQINEFNINE